MARTLEPACLSLDDAKSTLAHMTAIKNVAGVMEARLALRVADTSENKRVGFPSPEAWFASQTGTTASNARAQLDAAVRLANLDDVAAAANAGALSPEQTAVITEAATANPGAQEDLLNTARTSSIRELRNECDRVKAAADPDPDATNERLRSARRLRFSKGLDGAAKMFGATTPEQVAVIKATVDRRANDLFHAARREGRRERREAYAIDALEQICAEWMAGGAPAALGDDVAEADQPAPPKKNGKPQWLGILHLDVEAMIRGGVEGEERCEIAGLGPIPVSRARKLLGDSVLKLVLTRGVDVVNVTHLGRGPTIAQKIAMLWESPGCGITGCPRIQGIEHDHTLDWADSHHTVLSELKRRCDFHHMMKTRFGWEAVTLPDGTVTMVPPDDPLHRDNQTPGPDPP